MHVIFSLFIFQLAFWLEWRRGFEIYHERPRNAYGLRIDKHFNIVSHFSQDSKGLNFCAVTWWAYGAARYEMLDLSRVGMRMRRVGSRFFAQIAQIVLSLSLRGEFAGT